MEKKKKNNSFKFIFITLFVIFVALYISQSTGYYEYEQHQKTVLTDESIKQFEKDVKDGKNIDINNYLTDNNKNYNNKVSSMGMNVSNIIDKAIRTGLNGMMDILNKLLSD